MKPPIDIPAQLAALAAAEEHYVTDFAFDFRLHALYTLPSLTKQAAAGIRIYIDPSVCVAKWGTINGGAPHIDIIWSSMVFDPVANTFCYTSKLMGGIQEWQLRLSVSRCPPGFLQFCHSLSSP